MELVQQVIGIDPGVTIGVGVISVDGLLIANKDFRDPRIAFGWIVDLILINPSVVAIEDFIGGGPRTPDMVHTMQVLGYLRWSVEDTGTEVVLQQPQARKPYLREAQALLPAGHPIHQRDALAHAIRLRKDLQ